MCIVTSKENNLFASTVYANRIFRRYLHLLVPQIDELLTSSINRHEAISKLPPPTTVQRIKNILSDQSIIDYPVYRRCQTVGKDGARTVATGKIFRPYHNSLYLMLCDNKVFLHSRYIRYSKNGMVSLCKHSSEIRGNGCHSNEFMIFSFKLCMRE